MITVLSEVFPQLIERRINRLQIEALYHDDEGKAIIDGQIAALEWAEDFESLVCEAGWGIERL